MTANGKSRFGDDYPDYYVEVDGTEYLNCEGPAPDTSLLEPPETTLSNKLKGTYRGRFMAGKESEYLATLEAYTEIYNGESNNHTQALMSCRTYASLKRDAASGDVKVFGDSCRDRWCPMCCSQKAAFAKDQARNYIETLKDPRFLTLTLRNNESSLKSQVEFLQQSFSKLRTRSFWKKHVTGGIWFLECKRGKNSELWHPHLHILLDGDYLNQGELSRLWEQVTFGSPILYITSISDFDHAAFYVSKYCSKPAVLQNKPLEDRMEIIESLFRKRLCGTFGSAKCVTLTPPKVEDDCEWDYIDNFDNIAKRAETEPAARAIMVAFNNYEPISAELFEEYTGHPAGFISIMSPPKKVERQLYLDFYSSG